MEMDYYEILAEGIAARLFEFGGELSRTGLRPEKILESVTVALFKSMPEFRTASEEIVNEFTDKLGTAICDRMRIERGLETARGLKPS
jgi:hypothetical protein